MKNWLHYSILILLLSFLVFLSIPISHSAGFFNLGSFFKSNKGYYGDGSDGPETISTANTTINTYTYVTDATIDPGAISFTVNNAGGFSPGVKLLLHMTQGGSWDQLGSYEIVTVKSIATNTITVTSAIGNQYYSGSFNPDNNATGRKVTQVIRVAQYTNLNINGGASITAPSWNGYTGGIVVIMASGTISITGSINVSYKGFRGVAGSSDTNPSSCDNNDYGRRGETYAGTYPTGYGNSYGGGGGGGKYCTANNENQAGGGAGGSYGGYGQGGFGGALGGSGAAGVTGGGAVGWTYGDPGLSRVSFGSSGGGGGYCNGVGGSSGNGGGIVLLYADTINVTGSITANGMNGSNVTTGLAGGGGAGGAIRIEANTATLGTNLVTATGGSGGVDSQADACGTRNGGYGGDGRIRVIARSSYSGTTNPAAVDVKTSLHADTPRNPVLLTLTENSSTSVTLSWTAGGGGTVGHKIAWNATDTAPADCSSDNVISASTIGTATSYQLNSLAATTNHSFRVCGVNGKTTPDVSSGAVVYWTCPGNGASSGNNFTYREVVGPDDTYDAGMIYNASSNNYGSYGTISAGTHGWFSYWRERGLIKFDLSAIPSTATITSALLQLHVYHPNTSTLCISRYHASLNNPTVPSKCWTDWHPFEMHFFRLKKNWTESGATWNTYNGSTGWSSAGAGSAGNDYNNSSDGIWTVSSTWHGVSQAGLNADVDLTTPVQNFVNGTYANYGWLVRPEPEPAGGSYESEMITWFSSDTNDDFDEYWPRLKVRYKECTGNEFTECGGAGNSCYSSSFLSKGLSNANTPSGKSLEYVVASGSFYVWKEVGGSRIISADGFDNWQQSLNMNGKGHSGSDFTSYTSLAGRACPLQVYIDDSNKAESNKCVYYSVDRGAIPLNNDGTSQTDINTLGLGQWSTYDATPRWYTGNVKACADLGMRLPTLFESATNGYPIEGYDPSTTDGSRSFDRYIGVPGIPNHTWTSTANIQNANNYFAYTDTGGLGPNYPYSGTTWYHVRCVIPSN